MTQRATEAEIQAWVDGELPEADVERVLAAVMTDPEAAAQLEDCLQVRALGQALASPKVDAESDLERARRRRKRTRWTAAAAAVAAAAAAVVVYWVIRRGPGEPDGSALDRTLVASLGANRRVEPRLSWQAIDRYRPYETDRAAGALQPEPLSFELLAQIEQRHDPRSLAGANLLIGNLERAARELDQAPDTADTWSDRAALALIAGDHERALYATDQALARAADHAQARWNRALALAGLGLDRTAAAAFSQIAARGEPGWSREAATRAEVLAAQRVRRVAAWQRASAAAAAMVTGGPPALDQVAGFPGLVRLYFYDAVRAAGSAERVRALEPLARALDEAMGGDVLARHVARVAALPFTRRAALAGRYAELVAGTLAEAPRTALVRELRAGGRETDDLLIGALLLVGPGRRQINAADVAEYARLAEATGDPWFALLAQEERAAVAIGAGDFAGAASTLQVAAARCAGRDAIAYRCQRIARLETHVYFVMHRVKATQEAWARSRHAATGIIPMEDETLRTGAAVAKLRDDTGGRWLGLTRAYLDEWVASGVGCAETRSAHEELAQSLINQNRIAEAAALIDSEPPCDVPFTVQRAFLLAHLVRGGAQIEELRRKIATLRAAPATNAGERAQLDFVEGRVLLASSPEAGRALLRRVIAAATARDPQEAKARGYSFSVLVQDAGRRGAWSEVLALLAEERGAAAPERCVLGAAEEDAAVFAARGPDGAVRGAYLPLAVGQGPGEVAVPAELAAALAGCKVVDVYARPPYYGRAGLLAPGVALRFRTGGAPRTPSVGPTIVIGNVIPPPELHLAPLQPMTAEPGTTLIDGAAATPARVVAAMRGASFIEIHSHGLIGVADDDAAMLVLSPDPGGRYALTATDLAQVELARHPIVVLAACEAGTATPALHAAWGLADAILGAGASAVIASPSVIGDAAAPRFFAGVRARIQAGQGAVEALRDEREAWRDPAQRRWIDHLVVFE